MLSQKFFAAVKLSSIPAYRLALEVGLNPTTFSKFLIGYLKPKLWDPRLLAIGERLGLAKWDVFEVAEEDSCA